MKSVCSPPTICAGFRLATDSQGVGILTFAPSMPPSWPLWLWPHPNIWQSPKHTAYNTVLCDITDIFTYRGHKPWHMQPLTATDIIRQPIASESRLTQLSMNLIYQLKQLTSKQLYCNICQTLVPREQLFSIFPLLYFTDAISHFEIDCTVMDDDTVSTLKEPGSARKNIQCKLHSVLITCAATPKTEAISNHRNKK